MGLNPIDIKKGAIGPNILDNDDGISGLILTVAAGSTELPVNTTVAVYNMTDVEEIYGITEQFDVDQGAVAHRHISEFYRMAGEGNKLYLLLLPESNTMEALLQDDNSELAKMLLLFAKGEIRQLAVGINPSTAPAVLNGLNEDVYNSIPIAQGLHNWAYDKAMPLNLLLEGRDYTSPAASAADLRGITDVYADKVSVVIGQDWDYAESRAEETKGDILKKFADVGTALGCVAKAKINQNIGEVTPIFNLVDVTKGVWETPGLSSHEKVKDVDADLQTLDGKGYIFPVEYPDYPGTYWNSDHTCTEIIEDADGNLNENTISLGRPMDKAVRGLRRALMPLTKSTHLVDKTTGLLPKGTIKYFEGLGDNVFVRMELAKEISGGKTTVDPDSNIVTGDRNLGVTFEQVPTGQINALKGKINLKTKLS